MTDLAESKELVVVEALVPAVVFGPGGVDLIHAGIDGDIAVAVITAIAKGLVRHIRVEY